MLPSVATKTSIAPPARHYKNTVKCQATPGKTPAAGAPPSVAIDRRDLIIAATASFLASTLVTPPSSLADDFTETDTGLRYLDLKKGQGKLPRKGDTVVVHWAGYTEGYQGKRIDNTSARDEPYEFVLGSGQAIPAFDEAVAGMAAGGVRRVQVLGDHPELGYPRDRSERFSNDMSRDKIYKYKVGPQPAELGGQRALDFVLDNPTLQPFNRTLLFDIKLLNVRRPSR